MSVSHKCQYALRAIFELARRHGNGPTSIREIADAQGDEISSLQIRQVFEETYFRCTTPFKLEAFRTKKKIDADQIEVVNCVAHVAVDGVSQELRGVGNGPIDAFMEAMKEELVTDFTLLSYAEHSLSEGAEAEAIAYIQIETPSGETFFGAAIDTNIELASIKAVLSALNRALQTDLVRASRPAANEGKP